MIGFLNGKIIFIGEKEFILEVNGVGYRIFGSKSLISKLEKEKRGEIWTHTNVKENEISLYGFFEKEELDFFEVLIGVNGVGPKTALDILELNFEKVKTAIATGDTDFLKQAKGIGQKAAERILVELKNKIGKIDFIQAKTNQKNSNEVFEEAILALETLDYKKSEIIKKIRNAPEFETTEELVTWFLSN